MNDLSYAEYLAKTGEKDSREAWKWWKVLCCGMSEKEASKAAYDPEWGWKPGLLEGKFRTFRADAEAKNA